MEFNSETYPIGNFADEGIRGELGENNMTLNRTGIWTAAMADYYSGFGLGLLFEGGNMQTGTGIYPQAAMGVRCDKDEVRYGGMSDGSNTEIKDNFIEPKKTIVSSEELLYPNPFDNEIFIKNNKNVGFEIYDMGGTTVKTGVSQENRIPTNSLQKRFYILKVKTQDNQTITKKMVKY